MVCDRSAMTMPDPFNSDGFGFDFDGNDDYAELSTQITGANTTFSAWVNFDRFNEWSRVFEFNDGGISNLIGLGNRESSNDLSLYIYGQSSSSIIGEVNINDFWETDTWIHVTVVIGANRNLEVYKNGVLAGSATASQSIPASSVPITTLVITATVVMMAITDLTVKSPISG